MQKLNKINFKIGLYQLSIIHERKFKWLEPAIKQAAGKYESAAENYRRIIEDHLASSSDDVNKTEPRSTNERGDSQVMFKEWFITKLFTRFV